MKKVITYGTFDLLHYGNINLLKISMVIKSDLSNNIYKYKRGGG
ncbi:hypothetical protein [Helicobacter saguini]|nr:hypothetical protein [Helicobacter saguini]